jgi:hypothetical protein
MGGSGHVFSQGKIIADGAPLEIFQDKEVLKQANLKPPMLMDVYDLLVTNHMVDDTQAYPKSIREFAEMIGILGF